MWDLQICERMDLLTVLNSKKIFERHILLSDSVAESATQTLSFQGLKSRGQGCSTLPHEAWFPYKSSCCEYVVVICCRIVVIE